MVTVHIIFNAHIDPVWLWPWTSGLDALLATCRSACDRLDAHPDLHFCKGEAWGYDQIERVAPALFARIRRHIEAGRWHIVGGWWIQPDCNGPSGFALARQIEVGRQYFIERFGPRGFPREAYNPDSFGHAATLPALLRAAGQDRYVMMRPQEHELALPARLFRWCGYAGGPEVVTFRIAGNYAVREMTAEHVQAALSELPAGIAHTMCFVGLGDHGGGPTERQIAWIRANRDAIPGARLEFSSVARFFDAIWAQRETLPLVTGELQMHAVGCYSVYRPIKVAVRRAEHALRQAELAAAADPRPDVEAEGRLAAAWRRVAFAQFHDIYGGTCLPSAYEQVLAQLGEARAAADEALQHAFYRQIEQLPDDSLQRIVLYNASDRDFDGYTEHTAFFEQVPYRGDLRLLDEAGAAVPYQVVHPEAQIQWDATWCARLLCPTAAKPGQLRVLRLARESPQASAERVQATAEGGIRNDRNALVGGDAGAELQLGESVLPLPRLEVVPDLSDTWSHGVDRYGDNGAQNGVCAAGQVIERGPLRAALTHGAKLGAGAYRSEYRVYAGSAWVELLLNVHWAAQHEVLKLTFPLPSPALRRWDGIGGDERHPPAALERPNSGREVPVHDFTLVELADGRRLGLVLPDCHALDATPERVRITLLRSPLMAHHDPAPASSPRPVYADQGTHEFRFRIFCGGPEIDQALLDRHASMMHRPLLTADLTRGMPAQ